MLRFFPAPSPIANFHSKEGNREADLRKMNKSVVIRLVEAGLSILDAVCSARRLRSKYTSTYSFRNLTVQAQKALYNPTTHGMFGDISAYVSALTQHWPGPV